MLWHHLRQGELLDCRLQCDRYLVYRYFHRKSALVIRGFESLGWRMGMAFRGKVDYVLNSGRLA